MDQHASFEDFLNSSHGMSNFYDLLTPESIFNLLKTSRNVKGFIEDELRNKYKISGETRKL